MIAALFQREDEGVIVHSVVGAASAAGRTLGDVRALAGQSRAGGPKVRAMCPAPTTARTVFGVGRGPTLQRGQLYDNVSTREHLQRECRVTFTAIKSWTAVFEATPSARGETYTRYEVIPTTRDTTCNRYDVLWMTYTFTSRGKTSGLHEVSLMTRGKFCALHELTPITPSQTCSQ